MRSLTGMSVALMFAGALFGQNGQRQFGTPGVTGAFLGNPSTWRFVPNAGFPGGGGLRTIPGQRTPRYSGSGAIVVPYVYPMYVNGDGYDNSYAQQPAPQQPNVTVVYPPQAAPVIVNQFGQGAEPRDMAAGDNPEPVSVYQPADQADQPAAADHYLIALKDRTIYVAVAYWVNGDTLHYFTAGNVHNQASLSLVDRDLTARLNKESGVEVKLPAEK